MAFDTRNARMGGQLMRSELWVHYVVTRLPAELDGVGKFIGAITSAHAHQDKNHDETEKKSERAALTGIVEIDAPVSNWLSWFLCRPAPAVPPIPDGN
jgi:hypothetical protein